MCAMRTNRWWCNRVQLELAHDCGKRRQLWQVQCSQNTTVLARHRGGRGPERRRMPACSVTRLQLQRIYRRNTIRDSRGADRVLCSANLRGRTCGCCKHLPEPIGNRANCAQGRDRHPQCTSHRRERTRRFLPNELHLRQRVTQIVVKRRNVLHTYAIYL